eukprot:361003-Rhodomonas_salina.1
MEIGSHCKHSSIYTALDLGDYDVILGRPFQNYSGARIDPHECQVPTQRGLQKLPAWAASPDKGVKLIRLSLMDMMRELKIMEAEKAFVLVPGEVFKFDSTPCQTEPEKFKMTHKDPEIEERIKKETKKEENRKGHFSAISPDRSGRSGNINEGPNEVRQ